MRDVPLKLIPAGYRFLLCFRVRLSTIITPTKTMIRDRVERATKWFLVSTDQGKAKCIRFSIPIPTNAILG